MVSVLAARPAAPTPFIHPAEMEFSPKKETFSFFLF
jgi:hypothetical protein